MSEQAQNTAEMTQANKAAEGARTLPLNVAIINWSGLFFAVLQSVCSAFMALGSIRLLIGVGAFAAASSALQLADRMHINAIRIPMMILALLGSVLNLLALWRIWSLRRRPASAWRLQPVSKRKRASESFQFALSLLTILLLATEIAAHHHLFGKW